MRETIGTCLPASKCIQQRYSIFKAKNAISHPSRHVRVWREAGDAPHHWITLLSVPESIGPSLGRATVQRVIRLGEALLGALLGVFYLLEDPNAPKLVLPWPAPQWTGMNTRISLLEFFIGLERDATITWRTSEEFRERKMLRNRRWVANLSKLHTEKRRVAKQVNRKARKAALPAEVLTERLKSESEKAMARYATTKAGRTPEEHTAHLAEVYVKVKANTTPEKRQAKNVKVAARARERRAPEKIAKQMADHLIKEEEERHMTREEVLERDAKNEARLKKNAYEKRRSAGKRAEKKAADGSR